MKISKPRPENNSKNTSVVSSAEKQIGVAPVPTSKIGAIHQQQVNHLRVSMLRRDRQRTFPVVVLNVDVAVVLDKDRRSICEVVNGAFHQRRVTFSVHRVQNLKLLVRAFVAEFFEKHV